MPLFGSKFSPKKPPSRKSSATTTAGDHLEEMVSDDRAVKLKLGEQEALFKDGEWVQESGVGGSARKANKNLRSRVQQLEEENNLLRLKYEILLNMLTQSTAESHLQQREIHKLQKLTLPKK